ncbi:MAG: hypothetical protein OJF49_003629 [Ktedonobacterales bacterium]|nr:MAG: hypothetical protein OJF49_003629 [Ktedonobacterales bacterium]
MKRIYVLCAAITSGAARNMRDALTRTITPTSYTKGERR